MDVERESSKPKKEKEAHDLGREPLKRSPRETGLGTIVLSPPAAKALPERTCPVLRLAGLQLLGHGMQSALLCSSAIQTEGNNNPERRMCVVPQIELERFVLADLSQD